MSDLETAAQRLERAVARLEAASRRIAEQRAASPAAADPDATATVAARLEEAIQRIDQLLEE